MDGTNKHSWLYLRIDVEKGAWYIGRTGKHHYSLRRSGHKGMFAVNMKGDVTAIVVPSSDAHIRESEAIQFFIGFVGRSNVSNIKQVKTPVTGYRWE